MQVVVHQQLTGLLSPGEARKWARERGIDFSPRSPGGFALVSRWEGVPASTIVLAWQPLSGGTYPLSPLYKGERW